MFDPPSEMTTIELTVRFTLDSSYGWYQGSAVFRRATVRYFRQLAPGRYGLTVTVRYTDGRTRVVPYGEREVSAPLKREDCLKRVGSHHPIFKSVNKLVKRGTATSIDLQLRWKPPSGAQDIADTTVSSDLSSVSL